MTQKSSTTKKLRYLLDMFNNHLTSPLKGAILDSQISEFEKQFRVDNEGPLLYMGSRNFRVGPANTRSGFTLTTRNRSLVSDRVCLIPQGIPVLDMGTDGVVLPRGIFFSPTPDPYTYTVHNSVTDYLTVTTEWVGDGEKSRRHDLHPNLLERTGLYLSDLNCIMADGTLHLLDSEFNDFRDYVHIEVVKKFVITEDTEFSDDLSSIVGGPVVLMGNMSDKFSGCPLFNSPTNHWDTSRVTVMNEMFRGTTLFNQPVEGWDTSSVTDMSGMFQNTLRFNQSLGGWDTSMVNDMNRMFFSATAFDQPLEGWDTSRVTSMNRMFMAAVNFNQPLQGWNISNVEDMMFMFKNATNFDQTLQGWTDSEKLRYNRGMFEGSGGESQE